MSARVTPNNIIVTNRGDSFKFPLQLNIGTKVNPVFYDIMEGDYVYLGVMEANQPFENAIIKKKFGAEDYNYDYQYLMVRFTAQDTEHILPGTYYYEIKLFRDKKNVDDNYDAVDTILNRTKFIITN